MKTIAVVCEKGGTGKSVIANELYESYVRLGVPASLYSLDGQYTDAAGSKKADDAEVAVVDTPGVLTDNLKDIVSGADAVVIPVRPTPNDIEPFTRTVSIVSKNTKAPVVIVVNGWNRFRWARSRGQRTSSRFPSLRQSCKRRVRGSPSWTLTGTARPPRRCVRCAAR